MRTRKHALTLRLNDSEWEHLKMLVGATNDNTQTFLRQMILGAEIKARRPEQYRDLLYELSAIGNNINQIARAANARQSVSQTNIIAIQEMLASIWMKVKNM